MRFWCLFVAGIFLFLAAGSVVWPADDLLPDRDADTRVIIKAPLPGGAGKPSVYNLKKWTVEESADPVKRALDVYKKKSRPQYTRRVWITSKTGGARHLVVEYTAGEGSEIIFSPDEDFMYYVEAGPGGGSIVYGINLLSNKKFSLGTGNSVQSVNCPDKTNYIVVAPSGQAKVYQIYSADGQRMKASADLKGPVDIEKELCR